MRLIGRAILLSVVCCLGLTGCTNFERNTFNTLAASKAVIDQAQADYTARTIVQNACTYAVINDAKAAQTTAVDAMLVYEQEKNAGTSVTAQVATVTADVAALPAIIVQVKALYTNPAGCAVPKAQS
jgi:hypothetical protein